MKEINDMDVEERIELRSEKVRRMIGGIPPALSWWSTALLVVIFMTLIMVVAFVEWPYGYGETILQHLFN